MSSKAVSCIRATKLIRRSKQLRAAKKSASVEALKDQGPKTMDPEKLAGSFCLDPEWNLEHAGKHEPLAFVSLRRIKLKRPET